MTKTLHEHIGERFGYLVVIDVFRDKRGTKTRTYFKVKCDCGNTKDILAHNVKSKTKSCGCKNSDLKSKYAHKHGGWKTRIYGIYNGMKQRCYNENEERYHRYGGRGITICEEWLESFENFRDWALSNGYSDDLTIERINNDGNYEPDNCKWIPMKDQFKNRSSNPKPKRGEENHLSKLTQSNVDKIRSTVITRGTKARLAREYGVSKSAISAILNNKTWRNV